VAGRRPYRNGENRFWTRKPKTGNMNLKNIRAFALLLLALGLPLKAGDGFVGREFVERTEDGINWTEVAQINGTTDLPLKAVVFKNKLYLFGVSADPSHAEFVTSTADGETWSPWKRFLNGDTDLALTAITFRDKMYVFGISRDPSHGQFMTSTEDGERWTPWEKFIEGDTDLALTATTFRDKMYVFGISRDPSHREFVTIFDGEKWTPWKIFIEGDTDLALTATTFRDKMYVFGISRDPSHREFVTIFDGEKWTPWKIFIEGDTDFALTATTFRDNMYVFGIGRHASHRKFVTIYDGERWTPWQRFGSERLMVAPLSATEFQGKLYVFEVEGVKSEVEKGLLANIVDGLVSVLNVIKDGLTEPKDGPPVVPSAVAAPPNTASVPARGNSRVIVKNEAWNNMSIQVRVGSNTTPDQNPRYKSGEFILAKGTTLRIETAGEDVWVRRQSDPDHPNGNWAAWIHQSVVSGQEYRFSP